MAVSLTPAVAQDIVPGNGWTSLPPSWLTRTIRYGDQPEQRIQFGNRSKGATLIVEISGEWPGPGRVTTAWLNSHLIHKGYAYAVVTTTGLFSAKLDRRIADVAAAIVKLRTDATAKGIDPDRVVLIGAGSAAILAALLATDPRYLEAEGLSLDIIRGVYLLNPSGLEVSETVLPAQARDSLFGDAAMRRQLSPAAHVAAPNAAAFLIQVDDHARPTEGFARDYATRLQAAGTRVEVEIIPQMTMMSSTVGATDNLATRSLMRFLSSVGRGSAR